MCIRAIHWSLCSVKQCCHLLRVSNNYPHFCKTKTEPCLRSQGRVPHRSYKCDNENKFSINYKKTLYFNKHTPKIKDCKVHTKGKGEIKINQIKKELKQSTVIQKKHLHSTQYKGKINNPYSYPTPMTPSLPRLLLYIYIYIIYMYMYIYIFTFTNIMHLFNTFAQFSHYF